MNQSKETTKKLQIKLHQYVNRFKNVIYKPEMKFLYDTLLGLIKSKHIHLSKITRAVPAETTFKKRWEQLSYHLGKEDLSERLVAGYLSQKMVHQQPLRYRIYDGSDIQKPYAEKMEGLAYVRDGSESSGKGKTVTGPGYHWDNIIGVDDKGENIIPLAGEFYSVTEDKDFEKSENEKITRMWEQLDQALPNSCNMIDVVDRGGDRRVLIENRLSLDHFFIIRQRGDRHLGYQGKVLPLKTIAQKVKLHWHFSVHRVQHGKAIKHRYQVGCVRVDFPRNDLKTLWNKPLWLVVVKEEGVKKGYSWFLCYLPTDNPYEAMSLAMRGYQYRWKIEEYHRQVKQDYCLEKMVFLRYKKLRNMATLLFLLMGFIASLSKPVLDELCLNSNVLPTGRLKELPGYIYYRVCEALRILFSSVFTRPVPIDPFSDVLQFNFKT
jgi:hypothetical protein